MQKTTASPSLASDLHALTGLYAAVLHEVRRQARYGHVWPPHRHMIVPPPSVLRPQSTRRK